jgi:hypothetical protein
MQSEATTVDQYLAELSDDRREAIQAVREVILKNLPKGYEEGMQYGMIGYFVPHSVYPDGYHCDPSQPLPFAALASQKRHMAVYLMSICGNPDQETWFREAWGKTGRKLDMGKSCVRFRKIEDVPLGVIGQAIRRMPVKKLIEYYEDATKGRAAKRPKQAAKRTATHMHSAGSSRKVAVRKKRSVVKDRSPQTRPAKKAARKKTVAKKMAASKRRTVAKATVRKKATARHKNKPSTKR